MNLPGFSVRRPVFTSMVTLIAVLLGSVSFTRLQVDMLPAIEMPTITVSTSYDGADPVVMERLITQILEEILATVPGIEELSSRSSEGESRITARFTWGTDIDTAAVDVQARIEDEINELPDDITRPRVGKFDVASYPVVIMGISSPMDPVELTRLINERLRFRLAGIPGVAQVDTWGEFSREIRIELDPDQLNALNLPLPALLQSLRSANLDLPAGEIERGRHQVTVRAPAEFQTVDEVRRTIVAVRNGTPVRLSQIATVRDTYEKQNRIIRLNGNKGLRIAIRKQPSANTVEVAERVLKEIEAINRDFPLVDVVPVVNQGNFIQRSIENVATSVLYGGGLAVLVLLFFLRNLRSTLVIALAIPISIVATFAMVYLSGLTINLMTLGGLALGVGMIVDSSVVVLENIYRHHREEGTPLREAAETGAREVGSAIVAGTLTTLVIFLPMVFIEGVSGLLFRELGFTVVCALLCALLVALSLVPMLASRLLKAPEALEADRTAHPRGLRARLMDLSERGFEGLNRFYARVLDGGLRHPWLVVCFSAALLGLSLLLAPLIGREFLPPSDEGEVRVSGEMEIGTRLDLVDRQTLLLESLVFPEIPERLSSVTSSSAGTGRNPDAEGDLTITLVPAAERNRSNSEIADDLRKKLEGKVPGMDLRVRAPQGQFLLERILGTDDGISVEISGFELAVLQRLSLQVEKVLADIPGITDVENSRKSGVPEERFHIDRDKVADLGLSMQDVARALQIAVAGSEAGEFRSAGQSYRILVQLENAEQLSVDDLLGLLLPTPDGGTVSLRNLVTTEEQEGPAIITRKDQQRLITVQANVSGRDEGAVADDIRRALETIVQPDGYALTVAGNIEEQQKASKELGFSLILALLLVFMVMACQYESLTDPLIVMVSVPLAVVGVLGTLYLTSTTLNLQSVIGCIMLGGIVVNNAILLVDQSSRLMRAGMAVHEAVREAGRRRLRPILMTTLTTLLALFPLALGIGEGADAQAPMARAVLGGLTTSTLITLVLIPVIFLLVHRKKELPA